MRRARLPALLFAVIAMTAITALVLFGNPLEDSVPVSSVEAKPAAVASPPPPPRTRR